MSRATQSATDGHVSVEDQDGRSRSDTGESNQDPLQATVQATGRFAWKHLLSIVAISTAWFFASLPIVTVGPATVGAYRAVLSLRADEGLNLDAVRVTVRSQFVHATLFGLFPVVLGVAVVHYGLAYLTTGATVAGILAVAGTYVTLYACLVFVPAFIAMAGGNSVTDSLWYGYRWTAQNAVETIVLGTVTAVLLAVTLLGTIAFVLLFAGVVAAFHIEFVTGTDDTNPIRSDQ